MAHKYDGIPNNLKLQMQRVVYSFEPECLSCDGERSREDMDARVQQLSEEWFGLVNDVAIQSGIKVCYDEFENYAM